MIKTEPGKVTLLGGVAAKRKWYKRYSRMEKPIITETTNFSVHKSSAFEHFGHIGMQAQVILHGPKDITWDDGEKGGPPFYGWSILSLRITNANLPSQFESRSVYANLYDKSQQFGVLRATSWDWKGTREAFREQGANFKLIMPARFVKLPIEQLNKWLLAFKDLKTTVDERCPVNSEVPIRGLRIERDYKACLFEKVWQNQSVKYAKLNEKWNQIWHQMTEALEVGPFIDHLNEDFWLNQLEVKYDFQAYQPKWFNFE
jgi:hypothetical protein